MEARQWTNPGQPQTLQIAVMLLYLRAGLAFLVLMSTGLLSTLLLVLVGASVAAGYGIANERKWGYLVGVAVAAYALLPLALHLLDEGPTELLSINLLLSALFPVALFALLVHPQSRDYQRVWFK